MTTGRHSAAVLDPALDDYELAAALVREAGQLALLMRMAGLQLSLIHISEPTRP